jgi:hypothetical protein
MAKCSNCDASTELHINNVPVCLKCDASVPRELLVRRAANMSIEPPEFNSADNRDHDQ